MPLRVAARRIARRPLSAGRPTCTRRSKRPGRRSAWSSMSRRLVAAMTTTLSRAPKPSSSTSSWFRVPSRSESAPDMPAPRARPMASISSKKMIAPFSDLRAVANRSRTREAPTPTNVSTKSEPDRAKKGTPDSPATALASRVLPVPGGPWRITPCGMRAPTRRKRSGSLRKTTTSLSSSTASSQPATSVKRTGGASTWAFLRILPCDAAPPRPPRRPSAVGPADERDAAQDQDREDRRCRAAGRGSASGRSGPMRTPERSSSG